MPAAMIAITGQLPLSNIIGPAFLLLTILFVVTTGIQWRIPFQWQ